MKSSMKSSGSRQGNQCLLADVYLVATQRTRIVKESLGVEKSASRNKNERMKVMYIYPYLLIQERERRGDVEVNGNQVKMGAL